MQCPVCGSGFRKFLPYGRVSRANALCPSCLSLERHRLLWLYLQRETDFFEEPKKMLHIAPEHCFIDRFKSLKHLDYITADLESPLAEVKMDIHDIPFEENTFDLIFCNHVLEHVEDDIQAMREMFRVLKPNGWAILQIPIFHPQPEETQEDRSITDPNEREQVYGQSDHVRLYGKDYPNRIESAGFKPIQEKFAMKLPENEVQTYAVSADEIIYRAQK